MTMIKACLEEELPPGTKRIINMLGRTILIANVDSHYYAVDGLCPDQGANLGDGVLKGYLIRCPVHGSEFDLRTGKLLKGPWTGARDVPDLRSYPVVVEEGCVNIDML